MEAKDWIARIRQEDASVDGVALVIIMGARNKDVFYEGEADAREDLLAGIGIARRLVEKDMGL